MRRCNYAYLGFLFGLIGLIFLPLGFKAFAFFFPAIFLCVSVNQEKHKFNFLLFMVILFPFVFLTSQAFTFDASKPFDINSFQVYVNTGMKMFVAFVYYGIPILFSIMIVWAIIIGKVSSAGKLIVRTFMLMGALFIVLFAFIIIGYDPTGGMITQIGRFYISLISMIFQVPSMLYNIIDTIISAYNSIRNWLYKLSKTITQFFGGDPNDNKLSLPKMDNLPKLPAYNLNMTLDASYKEFNSMSYSEQIYSIHDILPITITFICLITAVFMTKKSWEKQIIKKLGELFGTKKEKQKKRNIQFPNVSFDLFISMVVILAVGWVLFLGYGKNYGRNPATDYTYFMYFTYYTIIIVVSVFALSTQEWIFYERSNFKNTIFGTIIGVVTLKLVLFMFTKQVLSAYSNEELNNDLAYIAITFTYIAPAESLFFFVLIPGMVMGIILKKIKTKTKIMTESEIKTKLINVNTLVKTFNIMLTTPGLEKKQRRYAIIQRGLDYLNKEKSKLEKIPPVYKQQIAEITGRARPFTLFCVFGIGLPAFLFASLHWVVLSYTTGISLFEFWICGLGAILFVVGMFFILLSVFMGYQSSIWGHAFYNVSTIMLVIIAMGV